MKYKKSLLAAACAVGILTLSGCGSSSDDSQSGSATASVPTNAIMAQSNAILVLTSVVNYSNTGSNQVSVSISDTTVPTLLGQTISPVGFISSPGQTGNTKLVSRSGESVTFNIIGTQTSNDASLGDHTLRLVTKSGTTTLSSTDITVTVLPNGTVGLSTYGAQDTFAYSVAPGDTVRDSVSYTFNGLDWRTIRCAGTTDKVQGLSVSEGALTFACGLNSGGTVVDAGEIVTSSGAAVVHWVLNGTTQTSGASALITRGDQYVLDSAPFSVAGAGVPSGSTLSSGAASVGYIFAANSNAPAGVEGGFTGVGGVTSGADLSTSFELAENAIAAVNRESTSNDAGLFYAFSNGTSGAYTINNGLGSPTLNSYAATSDPYGAGKNTVAWQSLNTSVQGSLVYLNYAVPRGTAIVEQLGISAGPSSLVKSDNNAKTSVAENTISAANNIATDTVLLDSQGAFFINSDTTASGSGIYEPQLSTVSFSAAANGLAVIVAADLDDPWAVDDAG
jgi:hypothetical protein